MAIQVELVGLRSRKQGPSYLPCFLRVTKLLVVGEGLSYCRSGLYDSFIADTNSRALIHDVIPG